MEVLPPLISDIVAFHYDVVDFGAHVPGSRLHVHPFYQLDFYLSGSIRVLLERGRSVRPLPGSALLIPPFEYHDYESEGTITFAGFKFHLHPRYWLRLRCPECLDSLPRSYQEIVHEAHRLSEAEPVLSRQRISAVATLCLVHVLHSQEAGGSGVSEHADPWAAKLADLFEQVAREPERRWSVAGLAGLCCVTPDHFCRCFRNLVGMPPERFLLEQKIRHAAMLLVERQLPAKEVAQECGYASVHSFSRAFKKVLKVGPAAYARGTRENRRP